MLKKQSKKLSLFAIFNMPITLTLALTLCTIVMASTFDDGMSAYKRKDYESAIRIWKPLAKRGHANAQYELALLYLRGEGTNVNYSQTAKWFESAAVNGHTQAQYYLGWIHQFGKGVQKNVSLAKKWYRLAADAGYSRAKDALHVIESSQKRRNERNEFSIDDAIALGKAMRQINDLFSSTSSGSNSTNSDSGYGNDSCRAKAINRIGKCESEMDWRSDSNEYVLYCYDSPDGGNANRCASGLEHTFPGEGYLMYCDTGNTDNRSIDAEEVIAKICN